MRSIILRLAAECAWVIGEVGHCLRVWFSKRR